MNLELLLKRRWLTERSSVGELFFDGVPECYTLEDKTRGPDEPKVFGQTAIPLGRYEVVINHSPRFHREMPLLLDVPGFEGVRIHPGNWPEDTEGCILVGRVLGAQPDEIRESRAAYDTLFPKLKAVALKGERIWLTVEVAVEVQPVV